MATFTKSWIGYDLPVDAIESHSAVRTLRAQGIEKRGTQEFHLLLAYFDSIEIETLSALLAQAEAETSFAFGETPLVFDGYGLIDSPAGKYAYFSPASGGAKAAGELKARLVALPAYNVAKNCRDLHVTIGGVDPLSVDKPKRGPLKQPFEAKGCLVFVGFDGKTYRVFFWNSASKTFVEEKPVVEELKNVVEQPVEEKKIVVEEKLAAVEEKKPIVEEVKTKIEEKPQVVGVEKVSIAVEEKSPVVEVPKPIVEEKKIAVEEKTIVVEEKKPEAKPVETKPAELAPAAEAKPTPPSAFTKTLILPTRVMPDAACAVYLLRAYGAKIFPGATEAAIVFAHEVPAGKSAEELVKEGALFIERRGECASIAFAKMLSVAERPELKKLLSFAKRDFEKKGTLSSDPIDRTFGLTGVAMMMNRVYSEDPRAVLEFLVSVFEAHVYDESRRPAEPHQA